jgi:hypothetical protein
MRNMMTIAIMNNHDDEKHDDNRDDEKHDENSDDE